MISSHYHKLDVVPPLVAQLPDAPQQLFILGDSLDALLAKPRVAIVGSRKMTPYGRQVTEELATKLASRGVVVVSGLAYGVDVTAHRAALAAGGQCLVVQGNGLDRLYPVAHTQIGEEIVRKGGVIVSEYPPGTLPRKHYFLERNRLVSGLSDIIIITEAAARSGTLNTAAHALNQGKPVFAVPGNITSPLAAGTNNLLKSGAVPLTSVDDLWPHLHIAEALSVLPAAATPEEFIILKLLQTGITDAGQLLQQSSLTVSSFNQTLTMLEITTKIRPLGNNHWALT